jgi:hypothetical protein
MKIPLIILVLLSLGLFSFGAPEAAKDVICDGCGMVNCTMGCGTVASATELEPGDTICEFCGMINCTMGCKAITYDAEYRKMVVMPGLPNWLYYAGIVTLVLMSFFFAETVGRRRIETKDRWRFDLLKWSRLKSYIKKPYAQMLFQWPVTIMYLFLVYAGLYGHQVINVVPLLTWTVWWAGLIFVILFAGKIWCYVCPWDLVASLLSRLRITGKGEARLNLGLKWPKMFRNVWPAVFFFILLTWLEIGYDITKSPMMTSYMAVAMLVLAIVPAFIFEKKSFCRYGCFVGRISGLYANFSPVEVRATDKGVCASCKSRDCFAGNEKGDPCPTSLCLATLEDNTYCTMCSECVKTCPSDNVSLNLRPFGEDLYNYSGPRKDEAFLAVVLLALTSFHGLTMTPLWENILEPSGTIISWIAQLTGLGRQGAFTVGMLGILVAPMLLYLAFCWIVVGVISRKDSDADDRSLSAMDIFVQFSYSLLPIALFYHLAHNGMHLFMEGQGVMTLISDPLGRGWDLFGTATKVYPPLLSTETIWILQVILVIIGHLFGIVVGHRTACRLFKSRTTSYIVEVPLLIAMILFSFFSLWLMHLDMNMRGSLM